MQKKYFIQQDASIYWIGKCFLENWRKNKRKKDRFTELEAKQRQPDQKLSDQRTQRRWAEFLSILWWRSTFPWSFRGMVIYSHWETLWVNDSVVPMKLKFSAEAFLYWEHLQPRFPVQIFQCLIFKSTRTLVNSFYLAVYFWGTHFFEIVILWLANGLKSH